MFRTIENFDLLRRFLYTAENNSLLREMNVKKSISTESFLAFAFVILLVLIPILYISINSYKPSAESEKFQNSRILKTIDRDIQIVSENPDLIFNETLSDDNAIASLDVDSEKYVNMYQVPEKFYPWVSDGAYLLENYSPIVDKIGVISIHPMSINIPSYLAQNITLGNNDYVIVATIANTANYRSDSCLCSDNIFVIKIVDLGTGLEEKLYEDVVDSVQGWKTIYLGISDYKNRNISFIIEGHAGGPCGLWCGEYATVDKFYVGRLE